MVKNIKFEVEVDDIKTSQVKNDTCPQSGEFEMDGEEIKVTMTFSSPNKAILENLFGEVGRTITYAVVQNSQTTLEDHTEDPGDEE